MILVNLICGRNPWKRASADDTTFRAFLRDANFLQTILPISSGLNWILQRIFDIDPKRRITLDALRECILRCPQLGSQPEATGLQTPPYSPADKPVSPYVLQPVPVMEPLPGQQFASPPPLPFHPAQQAAYLPPSPPPSTHGSPRHSQHTYPVDQAPVAACGPFAPAATAATSQIGFIPSLQAWSRCANFVPSHHGFLRNFATAF